MAKPAVLQRWAFDAVFGVPVVRGEIAGERVCAPWIWLNRGYVGISRCGRAEEAYLKLGEPALYPYPAVRPAPSEIAETLFRRGPPAPESQDAAAAA